MRTFACIACTLMATAAAISAVLGVHAPPQPAPKWAQRVATLIEQLDDDEYARRIAAEKELEGMGDKALSELRKAAKGHASYEVRWRSQLLLMATHRKSPSTGLELVLLKAGEFSMGSPTTETSRQHNETPHRVRMTGPFYLGAYEVTQEQWREVMRSNPSWFAETGGGRSKVADHNTDRFPVEQVTWFDAIQFCNELSKRDSFEPYYRLEDVAQSGGSITAARVTILGGHGYRLPTEAEWEFACRAGTTTPYHYGGGGNGHQSNVRGETMTGGYGGAIKGPNLERTTQVGSYEANAAGVYDMHGNVGEWCWDWYAQQYDTAVRDDPHGPESGKQRIWRGGAWMLTESSCRSASRAWHTPEETKDFIGFRIARNP